MWHRIGTLITSMTVVAVVGLAAARAEATCRLPEPQLQLTVPADGATGVPLDTAFVFFAALQPREVTLNDTPLTRDGLIWRAPEILEAETQYELKLRFDDSSGTSDGTLITQAFTTGTELAAGAPPPEPTIVDDEDATPGNFSSWSACERYAGSVGCADHNDPPWVRFTTQPSSAVGWIVRANDSHSEFDSLWPASCSTQILWRGYVSNDCFDFTAIDAAGRLSEPAQYCVENVVLRPDELPDAADAGTTADTDAGLSTDGDAGEPDEDDSSCSSAAGPASPLWLTLFALVVLRRRRRQTRPF